MARETEIGWLLGCSESEGWEYCFVFLEGRSGWMRSMKKRVTKRFLPAQSLSRYCLKRRDGLLAEDFAGSPRAAHRDLSFHGLIPLALKAVGFVCSFTSVPESIADLCSKYPVRSYILGGCFTVQALLTLSGCFIGEKSECPSKQFTHYSLWD